MWMEVERWCRARGDLEGCCVLLHQGRLVRSQSSGLWPSVRSRSLDGASGLDCKDLAVGGHQPQPRRFEGHMGENAPYIARSAVTLCSLWISGKGLVG